MQVNVLLDPDAREAAETVEELTDRGLEVDDLLDLLGVVTGTANEADIDELEAVDGVIRVEPARDVHVASRRMGS